jgi:hypothetical protein
MRRLAARIGKMMGSPASSDARYREGQHNSPIAANVLLEPSSVGSRLV